MIYLYLGALGKDLISGFEGIITVRSEWLYGCARLGLEKQKLEDDGSLPKIQWFDEQRVQIVKQGIHPAAPPQTSNIKLGDLVQDEISGFEGVCTSRTLWISGQLSLGVEADKMKKGKVLQAESFDAHRLTLVEARQPPVAKESKAVTGGPRQDPVQMEIPLSVSVSLGAPEPGYNERYWDR